MMVSASMDSDPVYMIWPIFKWLFLVSFHLFPLQNNFFPPKRNSPALTTWTYSSAQAPTCFVLTVDCRVSPFSNSTCLQSLLCDKTPPSKFEGEMQEIIWLCRYLQIHLMASITRFLNICWGKGWKMLVLACGNWFCETFERCHPGWPYDPGASEAGLCMMRVKKMFLCWPSTQEMNYEPKTSVCAITILQAVYYWRVSATPAARSMCFFQLSFWSRWKLLRESRSSSAAKV